MAVAQVRHSPSQNCGQCQLRAKDGRWLRGSALETGGRVCPEEGDEGSGLRNRMALGP